MVRDRLGSGFFTTLKRISTGKYRGCSEKSLSLADRSVHKQPKLLDEVEYREAFLATQRADPANFGRAPK